MEIAPPTARSLVAILVAAIVLLPHLAHAQSVPRLVERAQEARDAGEFGQAVELLLQAYDQYPDPALLFNAAKVHVDAKKCRDALDFMVQTVTLATPEDHAEVHRASANAIVKFECGEEATRLPTLRAGLAAHQSDYIALAIATRLDPEAECDETKALYQRVSVSQRVTEDVRAGATQVVEKLECGSDVSPDAVVRTNNRVWWGLAAGAVVSGVAAVVVDRQTLDTIEQADKAAAAGRGAEHDRLSADAEDGKLWTATLTTTTGLLAIGAFGVWYLEPFRQETGVSVAPSVSTDGARVDVLFEF